MKHTFNKDNWSGEKATINFKKDGSFRLYDEDFFIVKRLQSEAMGETAEVFAASDKGQKYPVASAFRGSNEMEWVADDGDFSSGLERQHAIVEVALAQVLFNII